jgi:disulfide bond formation protein DsbB
MSEKSLPTPDNQDDRDYLVMMYEEHAEHARQHETLRAAVTGFFIALIAGLLAAPGNENSPQKIIVGIIICIVSLLGLLLNEKHYERYHMHREILRGYRNSLEQGLGNKDLSKIRDKREECHKKEYRLFPWRNLCTLRLHHLWSAVYCLTFVVGVAWAVWGICHRP